MGVCVKYLHRHPKTGRLSYRRAYPDELRPYIPNQLSELKRSLGADSIHEPGAMERFQAAAAEYGADVAKARKVATRSFDPLDATKIARLVDAFVWGLHSGAEQAVRDRKADENLHAWEWLTDEFREWRREQDFDAVERHWGARARSLLEGQGWLIDPQDRDGFSNLCMALNEATSAASNTLSSGSELYFVELRSDPLTSLQQFVP